MIFGGLLWEESSSMTTTLPEPFQNKVTTYRLSKYLEIAIVITKVVLGFL